MTDVKDAFFIHSAGDPSQRELVEMVERVLGECGFHFWQYGDWDWQQLDEVWRQNRGAGGRLDMRRVIRGHLDPFRATMPGAVDQKALIGLLAVSRVIVFVLPIDNRLTEGVAFELDLLARDYDLLQRRQKGWTRYLLCRFDTGDTCEPQDAKLPDFDDELVLAVEASAEVAQRYEDYGWALGCMILRHLLEMDLADCGELECAADVETHPYFQMDVEYAAIILQRARDFLLTCQEAVLECQVLALETSFRRATVSLSAARPAQ